MGNFRCSPATATWLISKTVMFRDHCCCLHGLIGEHTHWTQIPRAIRPGRARGFWRRCYGARNAGRPPRSAPPTRTIKVGHYACRSPAPMRGRDTDQERRAAGDRGGERQGADVAGSRSRRYDLRQRHRDGRVSTISAQLRPITKKLARPPWSSQCRAANERRRQGDVADPEAADCQHHAELDHPDITNPAMAASFAPAGKAITSALVARPTRFQGPNMANYVAQS